MKEAKQDGQQWWDERQKPARRRWWLRPRNVILMTLLGLFIWGGVFVYGVMYAEPVISVDYRPRLVEMVKKKQGMPDGAENGWLVLRGLVEKVDEVTAQFVAHETIPDAAKKLLPSVIFDPTANVEGGHAREEVVRLNERYLNELKDKGIFDQLNQLSDLRFGVRISPEERLIDAMLPELGKARMLTRANAARMYLAHLRGDDRERFDAFDQCLAMAELETRQGCMIEYLVGIAIRAMMLNEIRQEFMDRPPTEAECVRAMQLLDARPLADGTAALEGERLLELDVVQTVFSDTGGGNGRLLIPQLNKLQSGLSTTGSTPGNDTLFDYKVCNLAGLVLADRSENVARINEFFENVLRQMQLSRAERLADPFSATDFMESLPRTYFVPQIVLPAVGKFFMSRDQIRLDDLATRVMIAVELHRARTGHYPEALSELVPGELAALPMDPFSGAGLGYRRMAPGEDAEGRPYLLYSFGGDGKDDGGKPSRGAYDALHSDKAAGTDFIINRPRPKPTPKPAESGDTE